MRVGLGYDIHAFGDGRKLILGGVEIAHTQGLVGHSDADALVHAICDALLGAMGEGDLGKHYPSSDQKFKSISSLILLEEVNGLLARKGYRLVNLDTVIIAQVPRLGPHLGAMQARIAEILKVNRETVNVKVKSGEGLDAIGREEAIAAHAVCLIEPVKTS
ncbi:MAG TPA: 2-C-methyl-D-erythritol 2,4-cyclodiphosphate synthase [Nitrospiraceae bacterium]|jgi:2-C-methyl-D-erythritol 2,4-cyclodiphosphate synthase|nr:2-C-methyl-D-erythritol 2,4-cyclodiphosphate synthase [Nitrospiraceae bacterium]